MSKACLNRSGKLLKTGRHCILESTLLFLHFIPLKKSTHIFMPLCYGHTVELCHNISEVQTILLHKMGTHITMLLQAERTGSWGQKWEEGKEEVLENKGRR